MRGRLSLLGSFRGDIPVAPFKRIRQISVFGCYFYGSLFANRGSWEARHRANVVLKAVSLIPRAY